MSRPRVREMAPAHQASLTLLAHPLIVSIGALLLAFGLLLARARGMSLWIDEEFTVRIASQPSLGAALDLIAMTERRPPLSYALFFGWFRLFPESEFAWRWLPLAWQLLGLALALAIAARLRPGTQRFAAPLLALSPFMLLYGPMVRAYSLTVCLGLGMTLCLLRRRPWGYALFAIAGVWTEYALWGLFAAHGLWLLWTERTGLWSRRGWWLALGLPALSALFQLSAVLNQSGRDLIPADLAASPLGIALKLAYPAYAYLLGETLFPWSPLAWVGLLGAGVALLGLRRAPRGAWLLALSGVVTLVAIVLVLTVIARDLPFVNVPSRAMVTAPLVILLIAAGLRGLPLRPASLAWAALLVSNAFALTNLFWGADYINPIYAVPTRQIAGLIQAEAAPGALVLADPDTVLHRYPTGHPLFETEDAAALQALDGTPSEVWLLTFGRDRTRVLAHDAAVRERLTEDGWQLVEQYTFVPQAPLYRRLKARLFGRDAYAAKATLEQWRPPDS